MSISSIFKLLGDSFDFQKKTENKPAFNNSVQTFNSSAQNNEAISFLTARSVNRDNPVKNPVLYKVYVEIPKDKEAFEYEQLEKAVIKAIFIKNGINPSRAAIEEVAERQKLDFTSKYDYQKKSYVFNDKNGLMLNSKAINVNGRTSRGYELDITAETEKTILADAKLAREITLSGKKSFSELTMEERLKMMTERTRKYLPPDVAEALKEIDPRMLMAGAMTVATISALAKRGVITSNGLLHIGGAISLAQLLKYGGDAQHILDLVETARSAEDLEKPAQELAELAKSGAIDLLLTATGYGVGKAAPKISWMGGKAIELSAEYADEISKLSKQKWAEYDAKIKKLGDSLFPEPEFAGVPKQSSKIGETKGSNIFESRAATPNSNIDRNGNFVGNLRGERVTLPDVSMESISYTKRSRIQWRELRQSFDRPNMGERAMFLKNLANDPRKVTQLQEAGLNELQIKTMKDGKVPDGWQVHHKLPLDDGGDNSFDNLILIKNEPYHKTITNYQTENTRRLQEGQTVILNFPVPSGFVYPPR